MAEERDDLLDAFFHPVKVGEGRIAADDLVGEDARQARVAGGIDQFGLADRQQQALGSTGVGAGVALAEVQILLQGIFFLASRFESLLEVAENAHDVTSLD